MLKAGFTAGTGQRLVIALVAVVALWALVWVVERPRAAGATLTSTVNTTRNVRLDLTASRPVTTWKVAIDGQAVEGSATPTTWSAEFPATRRRAAIAISVQADAPGPTALRARLDSENAWLDRTTWGDAVVKTELLLPACPP